MQFSYTFTPCTDTPTYTYISGANLAALTDYQVHALNVPADSDKGTAGVMLYIYVYNVHVHQAILWALNSNLRAIYRNHT